MTLKNHIGALIKKNSIVVDEENPGVIHVKGGLTLTDDSVQHNGTKYDIKSLDISEYDGRLFADHGDMWNGYTLEKRIGTLINVHKKGKKVIADGIEYAVNANPLALLAYNMTKDGFLRDFSIGTTGPYPEEDDNTYKNHSIFEVSQVGIANNKNAKLNAVAVNSIEQAKQNGMDTTQLEEALHLNDVDGSEGEGKNPTPPAENEEEEEEEVTPPAKSESTAEEGEEANEEEVEETNSKKVEKNSEAEITNHNNNKEETEDMKFVTVENSRDLAVKVKYTNAAGTEVEVELAPGATLDVAENQKDAVEKQIAEAKAPEANIADVVANAVAEATKPLAEKLASYEAAFNNGAKEPAFKNKKEEEGEEGDPQAHRNNSKQDSFKSMDWRERTVNQIESARQMLKSGSPVAADTLNTINEVNLAALKKDGVVENSMTIADFGNFVISRELLTEIEGCRNDYTPLVDATSWQETLSTQFAWLKRSGDINMQNVEFCDDDADGNLKPISEYSANIQTSDLEELAAVTPVCNAATRFLAVDLLSDVAAGYRNDYDRKRAQLVIARLEQAVEGNSNSVVYDTNPNVEALVSLLNAWKEIATCTPNGTFIMNSSSYASILAYALRAGVSGPLSQIFTTGNQPTMFGRPYIVVSDDLMPSLDSASTVSISVDGSTVTVNHAVFYANLNNFTGRTSGGLQYDLSTEAAYEDGGSVKSSFQRNELVLRGSFFRGGAVKDTDQVAGILSPGVS